MNDAEKNPIEVKVPEIEFFDAAHGVDFHWWHNNKTPYHTHTYYEIVVMKSGSVTHICNDKKGIMQKLDVFVLKPGDKHMFLASANSSQLNFSITEQELSSLCGFISDGLLQDIKNEAPRQICINEAQLEYILFLANQVNLRNDEHHLQSNSVLIKSMILNLLLEFNRCFKLQNQKRSNLPDWLISFLKEIRTPEIFNRPLDELYKLSHYSQTMLNHYFRQYMGTTLIAYIKKLKMTHATQLLLHSNYTISKIAEEINYTPSHFIHEFKRIYNASPTKYREKLHKK